MTSANRISNNLPMNHSLIVQYYCDWHEIRNEMKWFIGNCSKEKPESFRKSNSKWNEFFNNKDFV